MGEIAPSKTFRRYLRWVLSVGFGLFLLAIASTAIAQSSLPRLDIGAPHFQELYVDPQHGSDSFPGTSPDAALKTLSAAWSAIPQGQALTNGVRITILPGIMPESGIPNYLESRYGTAEAPIVIQSLAGRDSVVLGGDLNIFDTRYLYLIGVTIRPHPAGDTFHCEQCSHILLRDNELDGGARAAHETVKFNQSQYVYLEDNIIHGANDNAVDFVAVQYGHLVGNKIYNSEDWCAYVKGGSAYLRVEANEFFNCGTGGFTAGQGTGFEFMTAPWVHYEAYDIKFINNIVHDTEGAAIGVNGGLNVLLAFNTFYRVGSRSHGIEVVFGSRSCDGDAAACLARRNLGGWGVAAPGQDVAIPNRNITIANNILFNPTGFSSQYQHFAIYGPQSAPAGTNVTSPIRTDSGLIIKGNVIWNGPPTLPLGIEGGEQGCADSNPTCSAAQLIADNYINTIEPVLIAPASGDFRIAPGSELAGVAAVMLSPFPATDRPAPPLAPVGDLSNSIDFDRSGTARSTQSSPGAYILGAPLLTLTPTPRQPIQITIRINNFSRRKISRRTYTVRFAAHVLGASGVSLSARATNDSGSFKRALRVARWSASTFGIVGTLPTGRYLIAFSATGNGGAEGRSITRINL